MLSVIMLNVIMLSVVGLIVIMLSVVAPFLGTPEICQLYSRKQMLKLIKLVLKLHMDAAKACLKRCMPDIPFCIFCQKQFGIENAW